MPSAKSSLGRVIYTSTWGIRTAMGVSRSVERLALTVLEARLEAVGRTKTIAELTGPSPRNLGLSGRMSGLLRQAIDQTTRSGELELFHKILDQLVPDEARILGALSDGSSSPLVNIYRRHVSGSANDLVLGNMSLIGKTANLALISQTPAYVTHLNALGLVELGPEDPKLKVEYEILCADTAILQAMKVGSRWPLPARTERLTLRLSQFGMDLWTATQPEARP